MPVPLFANYCFVKSKEVRRRRLLKQRLTLPLRSQNDRPSSQKQVVFGLPGKRNSMVGKKTK